MAVRRPGLAEVDSLRLGGDPFRCEDPVYTSFCQHPGLNVSVNDAVLYLQDTTPGRPYEELLPHIKVVYSEQEVQTLQEHGVQFPDCPPEILPNGYYG